jgi:6-phosphofructokinase 2
LIPEKKLYCTEPLCEPSCGGINVARAVKKLGGEVVAAYLAVGYTGKIFTQLLTGELVESIVTETTENTRENLVVLETASNQQYRFGMPGPYISEPEWQACLKSIEQIQNVKYIVASGSLPRGVPIDIIVRIALIARKKNARLIIDTSGDALRQAEQAGVYLLKPNLGELSSLVGKEELNIELVDDAAREVKDNGNWVVVVVSMGPAGAMLVTKELAVQIMPPAVKRKSTVGVGDSMVAGMVLSLVEGENGFQSFEAFYKENKLRFTPEIINNILQTGKDIASAYRRKNKDEQDVLKKIINLFEN